jgi:hypothetical protein
MSIARRGFGRPFYVVITQLGGLHMPRTPSNVVRLKNYKPKPQRQKSRYERYPLPFFNRKARSTWDVTPTGNYSADCKTGRAYAVEFLKSCDGTVGWSSLLAQIVTDMICAAPSGTYPNGELKTNGIVIGFMSAIGRMLAVAVFNADMLRSDTYDRMLVVAAGYDSLVD